MAISAFGALASSILQNTFNAQQNEDQRAWSEKMWEKNNEYNTPANQMKRLRQAGINPHFALTGGQLGTGNSTSQASMTSPQPYDFSPIAQGAARSQELWQQRNMNEAEIGLKNAQAENQRLESITKLWRDYLSGMETLSKSNLNHAEKKNLEAKTHELWVNIQSLAERNEVNIEVQKSQKRVFDAQAAKDEASANYQNILNKFAHRQQVLISQNLEKQGREIDSAVNRNNREAALAEANKALSYAQKSGVDIDNNTKQQMAEYIVDEKFAQAEYERYKAGNEMKRYEEGELGYRLPAGGRKKSNPPSRSRK